MTKFIFYYHYVMQRWFLPLLVMLSVVMISCESQSLSQSNGDKKPSQTAPFYTGVLPEQSPRMSKIYDSSKIERHDPFILYHDGSYMIAAEIEELAMLEKYIPVFEKHGYSGNGYSWEGHIIQILKKTKPSLLEKLEFDPEAGGFYAFADSEETQRAFVKVLAPIFNDIPKLESFIKSADRSKIDY